MTHEIELKQAKSIQVGETILKTHSTGILLAHEVVSVLPLDDGKWIEIGAGNICHILSGDDVVAVVI
jgi:hypothetical protein